jgi:hypothetical protein
MSPQTSSGSGSGSGASVGSAVVASSSGSAVAVVGASALHAARCTLHAARCTLHAARCCDEHQNRDNDNDRNAFVNRHGFILGRAARASWTVTISIGRHRRRL